MNANRAQQRTGCSRASVHPIHGATAGETARLWLIVAAFVGVSPSARASGAPEDRAHAPAPPEAQFWDDAYALTTAELALGGVAIRNTESETIHQLARAVWHDGNRATAALNSIAHREKLATPRDVPPAWHMEIQRVTSLRGAAFDQAFLDFFRIREGNAMPEFADEADHGRTTALRQYANAELSVLAGHAEAARRALR